MPAYGNRNNWKGGIGKWPEIRVRVPPELKKALADHSYTTANQQALIVLQDWLSEQKEKEK